MKLRHMKNPILLGEEGTKKISINKKGKKSGGGKHLQCRILRPSEFIAMYDVIAKGDKDDLTNFSMCLLLGARYEECRNIQRNPKWYDGKTFIQIQEHKVKRVDNRRYIRLSNKGRTLIHYFFDVDRRLPSVQAWDEKLKRWSCLAGICELDKEGNQITNGITSRMLRKTWESWLMFYYPNYQILITKSQGHTLTTAMEHYLNMPFDEDDAKLMREWVEGWKPEER